MPALPTPAPTFLQIQDHEGKTITLTPNGDATKYGAFIELDAGDGAHTVAAHLTPEALHTIGAWARLHLGDVQISGV